MRFIESDDNLSLRGSALQEAIKDDIKLGLIPFWVSVASFIHLLVEKRNLVVICILLIQLSTKNNNNK